MSATRPYVLSIAGFDPSGGAGLLADIKTFEAHNVQGLGVCSALTFQNEREFLDTKWVDPGEILMQIDALFKLYRINWAKIGLIENLDILSRIIDHLKSYNSGINIIWDPILKATAGFVFHDKIPKEKLFEICKKIYLITPNIPEIMKLLPGVKQEAGADILSKYCKVLIKGGHRKNGFSTDTLYHTNHNNEIFETKRIKENTKHGTGCVHSSALLANLANGKKLERSCLDAKMYIEQFLMSNNSMLGYHKIAKVKTNIA
ncbi:MAG: hydroxymethylpyrimidine/phosphomethylpyrimidine kinase [Bacteroidetes bacterium]|nr:hydroxymethylpyrimidine/phosphomethylpyrimidine kinase [Bacteroidota bacterium]